MKSPKEHVAVIPNETDTQSSDETKENDQYRIEEIEVEELTIDGICGVY